MILFDFANLEGGTQQFRNRQKAMDWIDHQIESWLFLISPSDHAFGNIKAFRALKEAIQKGLERDAINEVIKAKRPVVYDSDAGLYIQNLLKSADTKRLFTYTEGLQWTPGGATPEEEAFAKLLRTVDRQIGRRINEALHRDDSYRTLIDRSESELGELAALKDRASAIIKDAHGQGAHYLNQLEGRKTEFEAEWVAVLEGYKEKLNLDKTQDLWRKRAIAHLANRSKFQKAIYGFGAATAVLPVFASVGFYQLAGWALRGEGIADWHRLIFTSAGTILILTLCLWATRLVVRLYMTEHHLAIDADSRAALGDTYVSLTSENGAAVDDRKIVLAALFRPVKDGLVQDDAMPLLSPAALASAALVSDKPKAG